MDSTDIKTNFVFVEKPYRRKGFSTRMIKAAVDYVKKQGGSIVEAYPVQPKKDKMPGILDNSVSAVGMQPKYR